MDRDRTIRVSSSSVATTTLVLLVAMGAATMGAAAPASASSDHGQRVRLTESKSVRAVAAVVAAVARDMVGGNCSSAVAVNVRSTVAVPGDEPQTRPREVLATPVADALLDAHLIDLPPPA